MMRPRVYVEIYELVTKLQALSQKGRQACGDDFFLGRGYVVLDADQFQGVQPLVPDQKTGARVSVSGLSDTTYINQVTLPGLSTGPDAVMAAILKPLWT